MPIENVGYDLLTPPPLNSGRIYQYIVYLKDDAGI